MEKSIKKSLVKCIAFSSGLLMLFQLFVLYLNEKAGLGIFTELLLLFLSWVLELIYIYRILSREIGMCSLEIEKIKELIDFGQDGKKEFIDFGKDGTKEPAEADKNFRYEEFRILYSSIFKIKKALKTERAEKERLDREQRYLFQNLIHDIKTPLTAVKGYAEGLLDDICKESWKKEKYLRTIIKKADEINRLTEDLSGLIKKEDRTEKTYLDLKYFEDLSEDLFQELSETGISFKFIFDEKDRDRIKLFQDKMLLGRVIGNIISNSVKYKKSSDSEIILSLGIEDAFLRISIKDNGIGINKQQLPHIFERFYRGELSASMAHGYGIGLSIVEDSVKRMGGFVKADSEENKWTEISIFLKIMTDAGIK